MNDEYRKIVAELNENIPQTAVIQREAWKGGPKLSYLTGAYVINRLNEVIGQGRWGYEIRDLKLVYEGDIDQASGQAYTTSYIATIRLNVFIEGNSVVFEEVGYGDGADKKSKGKAHELATKEAITDALKRAAKNLGISMGLGLYFKSGEYIDEAEPIKSTESVKEATKATPAKEIKGTAKTSTTAPKQDTEVLRKTIQTAFKVLQAQKRITKEAFVEEYLAGSKTSELSDAQVLNAITKLKTNFSDVIV